MSDGLRELGLELTETDQCVFIKEDVILIIYVNDCVILSKDKMKIFRTMESLKTRYSITDEGNREEYLRIKLEHNKDTLMM